jgi:hypothetical protein
MEINTNHREFLMNRKPERYPCMARTGQDRQSSLHKCLSNVGVSCEICKEGLSIGTDNIVVITVIVIRLLLFRK